MDEQELKKYRIPDDEYRNHNIITDPPNEAGLDLDDVNGIANKTLKYAIPLISAEARKQERERIRNWSKLFLGDKNILSTHSFQARYKLTSKEAMELPTWELWDIAFERQALKEGGKEAE